MFQLFFDTLGGKAKTKVYATFFVWLLIFHVDILFIGLFTDQGLIFKKTSLLKGEYLLSYLMGFGLWIFMILEVARILLATLVTYLMIWIIPKLLNKHSYRQELDVEFVLRDMKAQKEEALGTKEEKVAEQQLKIAQDEKRAIEQQLTNTKKEIEVALQKAKLEKDPKQPEWDSDYRAFYRTSYYESFGKIIDTVYEHQGNISSSYINAGLQPKEIAYFDSNALVYLVDGESIALTDKGKYFVKKYSEDMG